MAIGNTVLSTWFPALCICLYLQQVILLSIHPIKQKLHCPRFIDEETGSEAPLPVRELKAVIKVDFGSDNEV